MSRKGKAPATSLDDMDESEDHERVHGADDDHGSLSLAPLSLQGDEGTGASAARTDVSKDILLDLSQSSISSDQWEQPVRADDIAELRRILTPGVSCLESTTRIPASDQFQVGLEFEAMFRHTRRDDPHGARLSAAFRDSWDVYMEAFASVILNCHNEQRHGAGPADSDKAIAPMVMDPNVRANRLALTLDQYHPERENYSVWRIKQDRSIVRNADDEACRRVPFEICSPILHYDASQAWRAHVRHLFDRISGQGIQITTNATCGLHVHVSVAGRPWRLRELQHIAIAILHFEKNIFDLVPLWRRQNPYAMPNSRTFRLDQIGPSQEHRESAILRTEDIADLEDLIQNGRDAAWNFGNIDRGEGFTGNTIEFRLPPGVREPGEAWLWVEFTVAFLRAAMKWDTPEALTHSFYKASRKGLYRYLMNRGGIMGGSAKRSVNKLFGRRNPEEDRSTPDRSAEA